MPLCSPDCISPLILRLELWSVTLRLKPTVQVEYRYLIAHVHESEGDGDDKSIMVRHWETNRFPRTFSCQSELRFLKHRS